MARRPTQRQLLAELLEKYGPEIAAAFRAAIDDLRAGADLQGIINALEQGNIEGALQALHLDRAAYEPLEAKIREAYVASGRASVATMPSSATIGFRFNVGNPEAERWLKEHAADLVTGIVDADRQGLRRALAEGVQSGASPRSVGLNIVGRVSRATGRRQGGIIGLSGPQQAYAASARSELSSGSPAEMTRYLGRARRDKRFDATVRKAIREGTKLPAATVDAATQAYSNRLLSLRGEVIGRTESLAAIHAAKQESYLQLVADGKVPQDSVRRTWVSSSDARVRDAHATLNGETTGLTEAFTSPTGAQMMHPGDTALGAGPEDVVQCRCSLAYRIVFNPNEAPS